MHTPFARMFSMQCAALSLLLLGTQAVAQDGTVDAGFGDDGRTVVGFDIAAGNPIDVVLDSAVDGFSRAYLVGNVATAAGTRIGIARLRADGTLDANYGPDDVGLVVAPEQVGFSLTGASVASDALGNLLVAGTLTTDGNSDFAVCKFTNDGALTAFSNGFQCVKIAFDLGADNADVLQDMAVMNDGRIVLVGSVRQANHFIYGGVARLQASGDPDPTFNGNGRLSVKGNYGFERLSLNGVKVQVNGRIVAVGGGDEDFDVPGSTPFAVRIHANGTMDTDFGFMGMALYAALSDERDGRLEELALLPVTGVLVLDQEFIAVGSIESTAHAGLYDGYIVRSRTSGTAEPAFATQGRFLDTIGHTLSFADVELDGAGGLIAVGTVRPTANAVAGQNVYATRLLGDGTRDVFGFNTPFGYNLADHGLPGANDIANTAVYQRDRLLVAGASLRTATPPPNLDFSVTAFERRKIFADGIE